jgi:hypothetical protein
MTLHGTKFNRLNRGRGGGVRQALSSPGGCYEGHRLMGCIAVYSSID